MSEAGRLMVSTYDAVLGGEKRGIQRKAKRRFFIFNKGRFICLHHQEKEIAGGIFFETENVTKRKGKTEGK